MAQIEGAEAKRTKSTLGVVQRCFDECDVRDIESISYDRCKNNVMHQNMFILLETRRYKHSFRSALEKSKSTPHSYPLARMMVIRRQTTMEISEGGKQMRELKQETFCHKCVRASISETIANFRFRKYLCDDDDDDDGENLQYYIAGSCASHENLQYKIYKYDIHFCSPPKLYRFAYTLIQWK